MTNIQEDTGTELTTVRILWRCNECGHQELLNISPREHLATHGLYIDVRQWRGGSK